MLVAMQRRLQGRREDGFTLIELMVVVLIIAILIAIAIPTFLGARARAQDRAAQSNLRNALTAEKTYYTDNQVYSADVAATGALKTIEPSISWTADGTPATAGQVLVAISASPATVILGAYSASGSCFYIKDVATGSGAGTFYAKPATCSLVSTTTVTGASW
jgi:type IV pilus assembly protein PilA